MRISERMQRVKPSATMAVNAKAMELRAQGREIISLSVGEPDFQTPEHICQAGIKAIEEGFTRYTQVPGIPELRQAIAGYFKRYYDVDAPMDATIVSNGGKQSLYNIFMAILNSGDEVLIPAPYWVSYPAMVLLADGVPVSVPTQAENDFKVTIADLEKSITSKTRALILNSPSNPTGCHLSKAEAEAIADFAMSKDIFVISDEIYDQLVYPPGEYLSLSVLWEKHPDKIAVVNGLAKSFAATGWRVGYTLGHPDLIKAMSKLQGQSTSNICSIAQKAAVAALTGPCDHLELMRKTYERRRDLVLDVIKTWKDAFCPKPEGAFYVFPIVDAYYDATAPDSAALCTKLLEEAGVALVPGTAFGEDRAIRISYATSDEVLLEALDKVGKVLLHK